MRISDWSSDVCSSDLVRAYDPEGMDAARAMMSGVEFCDNPYVAAQGAAAVVIVTEWDALRALDLPRLKGIMSGDGLVDLRNIYRPADAEVAGFVYVSLGRGAAPAIEELVPADRKSTRL